MEEEHDMASLRARRKKSSVGLSCCFSTQHRRGASFDLPEIKGKCRDFISRMGRHRRHSSADFSYDSVSYALNFDDLPPSDEDDFLANNFTARLPASPPGTRPFDGHPPRKPLPRSTPEEMTEGNRELRKGFDTLSANMKRTGTQVKVAGSGGELSAPRAAAVADVKRSLELEDVTTSPSGISSNREILVQFN